MDLNPRDYRAWYGLGQTYELLHMPYHALYYFRCSSEPTLGLCAVNCCNHMAGQVQQQFHVPCKALYNGAEAVLWL